MFKKREGIVIDDTETDGNRSRSHSMLKKVVSRDHNVEYVSPFRDPSNVQAANYAKAKKMERFPTVSASSHFSRMSPNELGYKNISKSTKRAKDISFPSFLIANERRQGGIITDLELKEANLKYLRNSQILLNENGTSTQTKESSDEESSGDETSTDDATSTEASSTSTITTEGSEEETSNEQESTEIVSEEEVATIENVSSAGSVDQETIENEPTSTSLEADTVNQVIEEDRSQASITKAVEEPESATSTGAQNELETEEGEVNAPIEGSDANTKSENVEEEPEEGEEEEGNEPHEETEDESVQETEEKSLVEPINPDEAPMLHMGPPQPQSSSTGIMAIFKGNSSSNIQPVSKNPMSSPENPEYVIKTKQHGYLSKAVYDKVQYDQSVHQRWLDNLETTEEEKYQNKKTEYEDNLADIQSKIDNIHDLMDELKLKTSQKIEVMEYQLVKNILDMTQTHNDSKNKIFKETELMKLEKLNAKQDFISKQAEIRKEIENLSEEQTGVTDDFNEWNSKLNEITAQLDAKIEDIRAKNQQKLDIEQEMAKLNISKMELEEEIKKNEEIHKNNTELLTDLNVRKNYLPRINEIDNEIAGRLEKLSTIKKETIEENNRLTILTKKLEDERIARENEIRLKNEKLKREQEQKLQKQLAELKAKHNEELLEIQKKYEKKMAQQPKAVELPTDNSLYEYVTEEEVFSL
ncbi:hypothetical protein Kpol_480p14 [Vanderwaltozyma polyspora DSM 70294]|uniref:Uncharacterized protein n=1 Tax=Vanderwaltozyma polyspora (strain ATCC 22028 / DSM 70294 / BCRC 21397 / CBS 2163 / NBRC 10782 / NRRL Y-8283 / UCD 57-17) TaxID=436907 RepID=A7TP76_VANPO|nr:uncharacterized protein Kpol_480p14 [Vanderwaltozyma polyspora DSM 70294]EDO15927.1 hypothetical protein Kpol_480p14 [Vanderwaltozyma polyspora DSM 70294]